MYAATTGFTYTMGAERLKMHQEGFLCMNPASLNQKVGLQKKKSPHGDAIFSPSLPKSTWSEQHVNHGNMVLNDTKTKREEWKCIYSFMI